MDYLRDYKIIGDKVAFWGSFLSNFFPCTFVAYGKEFPTSEHFFHWKKAILFNDEERARYILMYKDPKAAKHHGRFVQNFNENKWSEWKTTYMFEALFYKFSQCEELRDELLWLRKRGLIFVEASPIDKIWGVGWHWNNRAVAEEDKWLGENLLGKLLTVVADFFIEVENGADYITALESQRVALTDLNVKLSYFAGVFK